MRVTSHRKRLATGHWLLVAVLVLASACGSSPSSPSSTTSPPATAAPITGLWAGTFRYTNCEGLRDCFALKGTTGPFTLRLVQDGNTVSGRFETKSFVVAVAGVSGARGVTLTGSAAPASASDYYGNVQVSNFTIAVDPALGLSGSVQYTASGGGDFSDNADLITYAATVVSATRRPLTDLAGWTGTWRGRFVIRSCTVNRGPDGCYAAQDNSVGPLTLTISDAGQVSGQLTITNVVVPVTGQIAGNTLQLTGDVSRPESGGPAVTRILSFSATADRFGQLTGTFHYEVDWESATPTSTSYGAELWEVVKQP